AEPRRLRNHALAHAPRVAKILREQPFRSCDEDHSAVSKLNEMANQHPTCLGEVEVDAIDDVVVLGDTVQHPRLARRDNRSNSLIVALDVQQDDSINAIAVCHALDANSAVDV